MSNTEAHIEQPWSPSWRSSAPVFAHRNLVRSLRSSTASQHSACCEGGFVDAVISARELRPRLVKLSNAALPVRTKTTCHSA